MGIGKNNSPQNPMTRIKKVAQPLSQVQGGSGTVPSAGYAIKPVQPTMTSNTRNTNANNMVATTTSNKDLKYANTGMTTSAPNGSPVSSSSSVGTVPSVGKGSVALTANPTLTNPATTNSSTTDSIASTYGNKDNRLASVDNTSLSSVGNVTTEPSKLTDINLQEQTEDITQPTLQDFIAEAQKLGQESVMANIDPDFASNLQRQLYGQNVGMSGLGTNVVSNALDQTLAPIAKQVGIETAQQELEYRQQDAEQKADTLFNLVETGQLTGAQAEQALIQQGIDPKSYMTPEQVVQKQEQEELDTYLAQIDDPIERDLINSVEEFQHYMEFGKSYEDELSDILTTKKSLREWKELFPTLKESISRLDAQVMSESQKSSNWLPWDKPDTGKIDTWNAQLNALKEIIADVESGKDPVYDIEEYESGAPAINESSNLTKDIMSTGALGAIGGFFN